jgi:DNA-binding MarR family transcriptional regulator
MVAEVFEMIKIASAARARARGAQSEELTEAEFLALDALIQHGPMSVGDIQKQIGVLPAQMSRIIRSLEHKGKNAFVQCAINPDDRRKIDVSITLKGRKAHDAYREARMALVTAILNDLSPEERRQFMHILRRMREGMTASMDES